MFVSAAPSSYSAAVQLSHKSSRFQAPDTAADIIIAYRDLELHSMFCPILFPLAGSYSSDHAENNTPFMHHCFGGTLPLREKGKSGPKKKIKKNCRYFKKVLAFQKHIAYNNTCVTENDIQA